MAILSFAFRAPNRAIDMHINLPPPCMHYTQAGTHRHHTQDAGTLCWV